MDRVVYIEKPRHTGKVAAAGRNGLIAKIHVAKKQLAMEDDSYRALLRRVTGKASASELSMGELESVIKEFTRLGFATAHPRAGERKQAVGDQAKKIRALWLNLWHLGEIADPSEHALAAYCKRMSGKDALQWVHGYDASLVINGLRGWLARIGWLGPDARLVELITEGRRRNQIDPNPHSVSYDAVANKAATIRAQHKMLSQELSFHPELMQVEVMDAAIEALGVRCRAMKNVKQAK